MKREKSLPYDAQPIVFAKWIRIIFLLLLIAGVIYLFYNSSQCIDGCGPYHNTTSVADLDGDGDLDVVLNNLRHETDTIIWAGATLWINQGGGKFTPRSVDLGGPSTAAGDLDSDGDADLVQMTYTASLHLNQGGDQGGVPGDFKQWRSIAPQENPHNWSSEGSIVLGDLNNDGRLDAIISYCCSNLIDKEEDFLPFLPWVWLNTIGSSTLDTLDDLPMRPTLGDLDGDGDLDVYAAMLPPRGDDYDSADRILLNDGRGDFADSGQRLENARMAGTAGSGAVALGDLDGDGDLDALVATSSGAAIWINQGGAQGGQAGVFTNSGLRLGRGHIEDVFLADLDADGDPDAVLGEKARATVWLDTMIAAGKAHASIWLNEGQAGFSDSGQRLRYTERYGLAVGDFNGDGYLDLLAVGTGYHLWLNQGDGSLQEGN
ncbi:MAG TPA: VCBS repeat-containing protein [Anaerolineales bacterium]